MWSFKPLGFRAVRFEGLGLAFTRPTAKTTSHKPKPTGGLLVIGSLNPKHPKTLKPLQQAPCLPKLKLLWSDLLTLKQPCCEHLNSSDINRSKLEELSPKIPNPKPLESKNPTILKPFQSKPRPRT